MKKDSSRNKENLIHKILIFFICSLATACLILIAYMIFDLPQQLPTILLSIIIVISLVLVYHLRVLYRKMIEKQKDLYHQTMTDDLTGLFNMRYIKTRMQEELKRAQRERGSFGIIFFDLDDFKEHNDRLGHLKGDQLLKKVATFLKKNTRSSETISRFGGDEFILLIPNSTFEEVKETALRIKDQITSKTFNIGEQEIKIKISGGIACYPEDGDNIEKLIKNADKNLYRAKSIGNQICSSPEKLPKPKLINNFSLNKRSSYLDKIAKKATQLYLLFQDKNTEIIRQDIKAEKRFILEGHDNTHSYEFIMVLKGQLLSLDHDRVLKEGDYITIRELKGKKHFKTLSPISLIYITNSPIFEEQSQKIESLISLTRKVEEKDQRTESHCERLQSLAMRIGEEMELEDQSLFRLVYASYLHDLGKIKIPGSILKKEGALSSEEWEIITRHPKWGEEIITQKLKGSFVKEMGEIVKQHHERYDGKGYPNGLKGKEILIEAQILALVDAYDAMTTNRPYQEALKEEIAIKEIKKGSGKQFNPSVIEAFLQII